MKVTNSIFKQFVLEHIVRPYMNMTSYYKKPVITYKDILSELLENEEYANCVYNRIAKGFISIDFEGFGKDRTSPLCSTIELNLKMRGVVQHRYQDVVFKFKSDNYF